LKSDVQWADFDRVEALISEGEAAAREALPRIQTLINGEYKYKSFDRERFLKSHLLT
jgi:hypothetical protein